MLVPHMAVQVELLELSEPAEAEQAEDLLAKVVAEVAVRPDLLERPTIFNTRGWRGVISWINFTVSWINLIRTLLL